ncbi:MAG TPA: hypothetical protein VN721_09110 [Flavipsychrobacter sp.]|nr:hypothetical protein [Flavipsychrobacter sp.]
MNRNIVKTTTAFLLAIALYFLLDFVGLPPLHRETATMLRAILLVLGVTVLLILYKISRNNGLLQ